MSSFLEERNFKAVISSNCTCYCAQVGVRSIVVNPSVRLCVCLSVREHIPNGSYGVAWPAWSTSCQFHVSLGRSLMSTNALFHLLWICRRFAVPQIHNKSKQAFIDIRLHLSIATPLMAVAARCSLHVAPITAKRDVIHKTGST